MKRKYLISKTMFLAGVLVLTAVGCGDDSSSDLNNDIQIASNEQNEVVSTPIEDEDDKESETEDEKLAENITNGQKNALGSAESYLMFMGFSKNGLIEQLEFDGYTEEEAIFAVENVDVDWNEQAVLSAENYLSFMSFSRSELIEQLKFDGFTTEQATFALDYIENAQAENTPNESLDAGSSEVTMGQKNALGSAEDYLVFMSFSREGLIDQLKFDGYSDDEAVYAVDNVGADWNEQAVMSAESYTMFMSFSKQGLIDQLKFDGFTTEQATYAVTELGY